jgi:hypothetical protein
MSVYADSELHHPRYCQWEYGIQLQVRLGDAQTNIRFVEILEQYSLSLLYSLLAFMHTHTLRQN